VHEHYESPRLTTVGSVRSLTMGQGFRGNDDHFVLAVFGYEFDVAYGTGS
jgi:hypothetical protein